METKKQRVFIHEIGHFISHEMNKKFYANFLGTESIRIYSCPNHFNEYCGETIPNKPENYNGIIEKIPLERLPNFLISLMYGCILQSIHQNEKNSVCINVNGQKDVDEWLGNLHSYNISFLNRKISPILEDYIKLCVEKNLFEKILKLTYSDFILNNYDSVYEFDIIKLNEILENFYIEHYPYYNQLVVEHRNLINDTLKNDKIGSCLLNKKNETR